MAELSERDQISVLEREVAILRGMSQRLAQDLLIEQGYPGSKQRVNKEISERFSLAERDIDV